MFLAFSLTILQHLSTVSSRLCRCSDVVRQGRGWWATRQPTEKNSSRQTGFFSRCPGPRTQRALCQQRLRALPGVPEHARAVFAGAWVPAQLLIARTALMKLSLQDARIVVRYMEPRRSAQGTVFIHEGDTQEIDYMRLLIEGEVTVKNVTSPHHALQTVTVLGPGSLMGEISLIDGKARTASCTAFTPLRCAVLSRGPLEALSNECPRTAIKLLLAVSLRVATRLRDTADKLKMYSQLLNATQQELHHVMRIGSRQLHGRSPSVVAQHQQHFFDRVAAVSGATQAMLRNGRHIHGLT